MFVNPNLNRDEWLIQDIADYLKLSYSHTRTIIRGLKIKPKRRIQQVPVYTSAHMRRIQRRNTKTGPNNRKKG